MFSVLPYLHYLGYYGHSHSNHDYAWSYSYHLCPCINKHVDVDDVGEDDDYGNGEGDHRI